MLLCVFFDLTNQVCKYFKFLCNTYLVFENLKGDCLKILILGKLGLKLVFWKSISSHTHAFYSLYSMLWGVFLKARLFSFLNFVFPKFRLIQSVCWSIEIAFKILSEPLYVSKLIFDQLKIVNKLFLKLDLNLFNSPFSKVFKLFSLSSTQQGSTANFLSFSS